MSVEMPEWCGACDAKTRRFDYGDREQRCSDCHPYWAFSHASVEPARVPVTQTQQELAVRWLQYELVSLRLVQPVELRRRTRAFFEAGWSVLDIVHALDFDPDGSRARVIPLATDSRELSERKVLNLLTAWLDEAGAPLASPSQLALARREHMRERQQSLRVMLAELAAREVNPEMPVLSGAREAAARAAEFGRKLKLEGRKRERAAAQATLKSQRQQARQVEQTLRKLDRMKFGVVKGKGRKPALEGRAEAAVEAQQAA